MGVHLEHPLIDVALALAFPGLGIALLVGLGLFTAARITRHIYRSRRRS